MNTRLQLALGLLSLSTVEAALSQTQQDAVVLKHNELRASMGASDMMMLTWSPTLADAAQAHSSSCPGDHSTRLNNVGENMASSWSSSFVLSGTTDLTSSVQSWFDEKSDAGPYQTGGKFDGFTPCTGVCGHYTQVVWQAANEIGCGVASCPHGTGMAGYQLTCQYGSSVPGGYGGNMGGATVFTEGTACAACPNDFKTCTTSPAGLCTSGSATQAPTTEAPATDAPATKAPVTEAPSTKNPSPCTESPSEAPATKAPATAAPATGAPATAAPATGAPATGAPATGAPVTAAPATGAPATGAPATGAPATGAPATEAPATEAPATQAPATVATNIIVEIAVGDTVLTCASNAGFAVGDKVMVGTEEKTIVAIGAISNSSRRLTGTVSITVSPPMAATFPVGTAVTRIAPVAPANPCGVVAPVPVVTTLTTTPAPTGTTVTTTPGATVTTTPAGTVTTTPSATVTTTPAPPAAPPAPASPCGTVAPAALYDAKAAVLAQQAAAAQKELKDTSASPAGWALPLFAAVALFSFVSFVAVQRRRVNRSTRHVQLHPYNGTDEEYGCSSGSDEQIE